MIFWSCLLLLFFAFSFCNVKIFFTNSITQNKFQEIFPKISGINACFYNANQHVIASVKIMLFNAIASLSSIQKF